MSVLHDKIQKLCSERNVSIYRMCHDLHISTQQIYSLKYGRRRKLQPAYAKAIAEYFGVTVDSLMNDNKKEVSFVSEGSVNTDSVAPVDVNCILTDGETEKEIIKACVSLELLSRKIYSMTTSIKEAFPSIYGADGARFKDLRERVLARSGGRCEKCNCKSDELHVHHKNPTSLGFPKICAEEDLYALCPTCHYFVHRNPEKNHEFIFNVSEDSY